MGKKIRNLLGTLFLITAIVVTQIPVTDVEDAVSKMLEYLKNEKKDCLSQ